MDELSPLGVFLVRSGSNGDRLLFKYPFEPPKNSRNSTHPKSPYAMSVCEDDLLFLSKAPGTSGEVLCDNFVTISDRDLSTLFACQGGLCHYKFELKINNVRFIGHPQLLQSKAQRSMPKNSNQDDSNDTSTHMLNVVFALRAQAGHDIVKQYHDLSKRIAHALTSEENKNGYFSKECEKMVQILDHFTDGSQSDDEMSGPDEAGVSTVNPYQRILKASDLARVLQQAFTDLCKSGALYLKMNGNNLYPFCVPHKTHKLSTPTHAVQVDALQKCVDQVKPYHALLLVVTPEELVASLNSEYRRALERLILCASATKNMIELGYDTDITLESVMELTLPLVYFAHAIVIFPVRATNRYVLAPNAPTRWNHPLVEEFSQRFCDMYLPTIQAEFSMPTSISHIYNPQIHDASYMEKLQDIVIWCLQKRILMQVHIYVYLVIPDSSTENPLNWHKSSNNFSEYRESSLKSSNEQASAKPEKRNEDDIEEFPTIWKNLTDQQKKHIEDVPAFNNAEDRSLFLRCLVFFDGKNHIEHIMYSLNVTRSKLMHLIDKFQQVLVTVEHPDPAFDVFYK